MKRINSKDKTHFRAISVGGRDVVLCHTAQPINLGVSTYVANTVGISIKNPDDTFNEDIGKNIAYGRSIKTPVNKFTITSTRHLPKPIVGEILEWAVQDVTNRIEDYVAKFRETIAN